MKVCIVVTHLLGTGHLSRALTLARAFRDAGHQPVVISGGMPVPHLDSAGIPMLHLPPLRSDGVDFSRLLDKDGAPASGTLFDTRHKMLIAHIEADPPDALITELFPFGRRSLRDELTALLETAHALPHRPLICASIRDILAPPSKPAKAALADDLIAQFYDAVLVHADGEVTPLELSWPVPEEWRAKLHYTGFVAPPAAGPHPESLGDGEVLVSAGGGGVGDHIFATAVAAASQDADRPWRLLVGGQNALGRCRLLAQSAAANTTVEPAHSAFRQMLYHASASVSMCGYNTALDVLQSGVRAIFVPFDAGSEIEQGLRARALADLPGIAVLKNANLTPETLLQALQTVSEGPQRAPRLQGFDGAARTVDIVEGLWVKMA